MGDTNGASPEVIGEGSVLMATTCFPKDGLSGANGHDQLDVTCMINTISGLISDVVFFSEFKDVNETSITNFDALRALGDQEMNKLLKSVKKH